ncbi:hypothetical protein H2202_001959 [Exophiala xenobiotica]|nr:hypothetical protein H2202_001959 [Exophiala xenobiotica]KAK5210182.1 hypothetical protein LTR41_003850 [Exophiala xenobiotica]KAK5228603.1 hypothetical protein LTR72_002487 [Exophiala xenobiotica]KAK5238328.1 hypothetical protein LTR47_000071 [Exophiala xenobiotica]KAK5252690.1 hypothetical protein LTS06_002867 [Exophiala xenobiotica]
MSLADDAGQSRNINDLPSEVLELVLTKVKGSSQLDEYRPFPNALTACRRSSQPNEDRSFLNALTVCSLWKAVGEKVLWTDVSVSDTNLDKFCQSTSTAMSMTRTFTLTMQIDAGGWSVYDEGWVNSQVVQQMWQLLKKLPSTIGKMQALESFSFTVKPSDCVQELPSSARIRRSDLRAILDALPLTLRHLEISTNCSWDTVAAMGKSDHVSANNSDHVCPSIRRLLPNLRDLRLRVCELCEDFIPSTPSNIGPIDAGSKGALIINGADLTKHCRYAGAKFHTTVEEVRSEQASGFRRLGSAIRTAFSNGLLDSFQHCTIISICHVGIQAHLGKPLPGKEFTTVYESRLYPIPRQIKHPVYIIGRGWYVTRFRRSDGEAMELIQPGQDHIYIERDTWKTVDDGIRVANSYMECRPRFRRYAGGTIQILHPERDQLARCEEPGLPCQLRLLERKVGKWLLRPQMTKDLDDFELVRLDHYDEGEDSFGGFDYIDNQDNDSQHGGDHDWQEDGPSEEQEEAEGEEQQAEADSDWEL